MILDILLNLLYGTINIILAPVRALPDASLPQGLKDAITQVPGYLEPLEFALPLSTIYTIIGLVVLVEGAFITWHLVNWLIKKIPGIN